MISQRANPFAYWISQFLYVFALSFLILILEDPTTEEARQDSKSFKSATAVKPWDSQTIPYYFIHTTDIHVSHLKDQTELVRTRLQNIHTHLKPEKILITGDLADNVRSEDVKNKFTGQLKEDWDLLEEVLNDSGFSPEQFMITPGNHDMFLIASWDSKTHFGKNLIYNKSTYEFNRIQLTDGVSILLTSPYQFPGAAINHFWWVQPTRAYRNRFEKQVANDVQIVATHAPYRLWYDRDWLDHQLNKNNVNLLLSGHKHPQKFRYFHINDCLEIVGQPLFRYNKVGVVSIDNGRYVYHEVEIAAGQAIMTHPVPTKQITDHTIFNDEHTEIRALAFSDVALDLRVTGAVNATLDCRHVRDGVWLCTAPLDLPPGNYQLRKRGDWSGTVTFTIGETSPSVNEFVYCAEKHSEYIILCSVFLVIEFFVAFPYRFPWFDMVEEWIEGRNEMRPIYWVVTVLAGPVLIQNRISRNSWVLRIGALFVVLAPLLIPIVLINNDSHTMMYWFWGVAMGSESYNVWYGQRDGLMYYAFIGCPALLMAAMFGAFKMESMYGIFDVIFYVGLYCYFTFSPTSVLPIGFHGMENDYSETSAFWSPLFRIAPAIFFILIIIEGILWWRKKSKFAPSDQSNLSNMNIYTEMP